MVSFFEKLKKGMGTETIEEPESEPQEPPKDSPKPVREAKKSRKIEVRAVATKASEKQKKSGEPAEKKVLDEETDNREPDFALQNLGNHEGQLAVDVYQTETEVVIQSAVAGIKPENLDVSIEADVVLISGNRRSLPENGTKNYFYQECFWGPFSRQIILPEETDPSRAKAEMKEGVLTIRIPKIERKKKRKIAIREE
jgi:HSP20 family molecular chaperone IbpA